MKDIERLARAICLQMQFKDFGHHEEHDGEMCFVNNLEQIKLLDEACEKAARAVLRALHPMLDENGQAWIDHMLSEAE